MMLYNAINFFITFLALSFLFTEMVKRVVNGKCNSMHP